MRQTGLGTLAVNAAGGSGGAHGTPSIVVNFLGPVADEFVADRVVKRIQKKAHGRAVALSGGAG